MKYFFILLALTASLISVSGKIPSYIHVCKRNDPDLEKCVENSIHNLRDMLAKGIPELDVPPIDPQHLKKVALKLGPGLKAEGRDLLVKGGKNFRVRDLVVDIDANTYSFTVSIPEITAEGTYEVDATIVGIPIKGKGPVTITARSITGRGTLHGKQAIRSGKTFNWFSSMDLKLEIGNYTVQADNLFGGDPTIGKVTNKLLNEHGAEILASVLPKFEETLIEHNLRTANNICKHFTWDELFPES